MIRILLVDDRSVGRGLRMWLALESDFTVVGEAGTGTDPCPLVASLHPDVVLLDLELPGIDATPTIARLCVAEPAVSVVVLSLYDDAVARAKARAAGARAFVAKHEMCPNLPNTIRRVAAQRGEPGGPVTACES